MSASNNNNAFDVTTASQRPTTGYRSSTASGRPSTSHYNRGGTAMSRGGGGGFQLESSLSGASMGSTRIGTALGYAGNFMAAERPLTQHGLSGLPTTAAAGGGGGGGALSTASGLRLGTAGGMRQIKDKRYWQAQLQMKMTEIQRETERLAREREAMQREQSARRSFERCVQEAAKELTTLQSTLADMNIVLDAHTSGLTRHQLQQECSVLRSHNEQAQSQLEHQFHQRQERSAAAEAAHATIAAERQRLDDLVHSLDADDQLRYRQLQAGAAALHQQLAAAQERDSAAAAQLQRLQAATSQSSARSEAARLHSRLEELAQRAAAMRTEDAQRPSPAQEREQLIASVRDNQQTLQACQNQLRLAETQLQQRRELLSQIEQDIEEGQSDRHAKYKELRRRDETMSAFMATFAASMAAEKHAVEVLQQRITYGIERITMQGINLKQFGIQQPGAEGDGADGGVSSSTNDLASHDGLTHQYKRLSVRLQQLQLLERRTVRQLEELRSTEQRQRADAARFGAVAALREEAATRMAELTASVEELQKKRQTTEGVVAEARRRNEELRARLTGHEGYRKIAHLEERLAELMRANGAAQQQLEQQRREHDYGELKRKVEVQLAAVHGGLMAAATTAGSG